VPECDGKGSCGDSESLDAEIAGKNGDEAEKSFTEPRESGMVPSSADAIASAESAQEIQDSSWVTQESDSVNCHAYQKTWSSKTTKL
jgi:hypothetical protein